MTSLILLTFAIGLTSGCLLSLAYSLYFTASSHPAARPDLTVPVITSLAGIAATALLFALEHML